MKVITASQTTASLETILLALKQQLSQINHLLRDEARSDKSRKSKQRAWILLLGTDHCGKTSLVNSAELTVTEKLSHDNPHCNTWITEHAIYIELPAAIIEAESNIWQKTWKLISNADHNAALDHLVILLDCSDIVTPERLAIQLNFLTRIQAFITLTKPELSSSVIFTKIDNIAGFNSFFQDLSNEDRRQVFGFDCSSETLADQSLPDHCRQQLQALTDRLHEQLTWRLQKISSQQQRTLCYEFPLQFESLANLIVQCIQKLSSEFNAHAGYRLTGVYFTCSIQTPKVFDRLATSMADNFDIQTSYNNSDVPNSQAYFCHDLLQTRLPGSAIRTRQPLQGSKNKIWHQTKISLVVVISLLATWQLTVDFNHHLSALNQTQLATQQLTLSHQPNRSQQSDLLDLALLRQASQTATQVKQLPLTHYLLPEITHLQNNLITQYQQVLSQAYFAQLLQTLTQELSAHHDPIAQYETLKIYLMFVRPQHFQADAVLQWFTRYWQQQANLSDIELKIRTDLLKDLLQRKLPAITPDSKLIQAARADLKTLPPALLYYLALKAQHNDKGINPIENDSAVFIYTGQQNTIPQLYTQRGFQQLLNQSLPPQIHLTQSDWVLGSDATGSTNSDPTVLAQQIRTLYLADYANWWHLFLYNSQPVVFRDLHQADQSLTALAGKQSPLIKFLAAVKANTHSLPDSIPGAVQFNQQIASAFNSINKLDPNYFIKLQSHLSQLRDWIHAIASRSDTNKAAFTMAQSLYLAAKPTDPIAQLLKFADGSPQPLQGWLRAIAVNSWYLILHKSVAYLDEQWQTQIWPLYSMNIAGRFPLDQNAKQEILLKPFISFFAPKGTLDNFFQTQLRPFLNTTQAKWQPKSLYNLQLPLQQAVINQFIRAHLIQQMFFPANNQNLFVHFKLKPISLEPIVHDVSLNFYGQKVVGYQGSEINHDFVWPINSSSQQVELAFNDITGHTQQIQLDGAWAWLRLLQQANLNPLQGTQEFELMFDLKGNAAKYQLTAETVINPFINGILNQFSLPRALI